MPVTVRIEPPKGWSLPDLGELWDYRELAAFIVWRDVKVRYKQTALGVAWAVLQPLVTMVVFTVIFGRLAKLPSDGVPYPVFALAGAAAVAAVRERPRRRRRTASSAARA